LCAASAPTRERGWRKRWTAARSRRTWTRCVSARVWRKTRRWRWRVRARFAGTRWIGIRRSGRRGRSRAARERWLPGLRAVVDRPVTLPPVTTDDELRLDLRALGLTPGRHILETLRPTLTHRALRRATDLAMVRAGVMVEVAGQTISRQCPGTAQGVVFLTLSDETGLINAVVRPPVYARNRAAIRGEALLWLGGVVEHRHGAVTLRIVWARPLAVALAREDRG